MAVKLTEKQMSAIALLAEGIPHHEIARQLGVGLRTVERWSTRPDIRQAVQSARARAIEVLGEEIFQKCREGVTKTLPKAVRKLAEALDNPDARIQIRAVEIIGKWSGFYQPQTKPEQQNRSAEDDLKAYLRHLEAGGSNGHLN